MQQLRSWAAPVKNLSCVRKPTIELQAHTTKTDLVHNIHLPYIIWWLAVSTINAPQIAKRLLRFALQHFGWNYPQLLSRLIWLWFQFMSLRRSHSQSDPCPAGFMPCPAPALPNMHLSDNKKKHTHTQTIDNRRVPPPTAVINRVCVFIVCYNCVSFI